MVVMTDAWLLVCVFRLLQMSSWAVTVFLVLLILLHLIFCCCYVAFKIRARGRANFEVEMDNTVPSPFQQPQLSWRNERADCNDDDEPLVDPADPTPSSQYESW